MKISRLMPCVVVAAMLASAAAPAPAHAQVGGLLKKKLKEKISQKVGGPDSAAAAAEPSAPGAATKPARAAPSRPGPQFTEYLLEITPDVLDRMEKGLAAEAAVRQEIDRKIGKVLSHDEYEKCQMAVLQTPEGRKVYEQFLVKGDTSAAGLRKASEDLARRMEQVVEPKCGLEARKAEDIRTQNADRMEAAAPQASGLTRLQLTLLKERILPLCAAAQAVTAPTGEVRVSAAASGSTDPIYYVYTPTEVSAAQPRCAKLSSALRASQ